MASLPIPGCDLDILSARSLADPYEDYRTLRELGDVAWLERLGVFALSRYETVQKALRAADQLVSGEGAGFTDLFNSGKQRSVLQADGDLHRRLRSVILQPLSPAALKGFRGKFKSLITNRIEELVGEGWFDAMTQLASFLPVSAVSHLVGIPEEFRARMLDWAAASFNVIAPGFPARDAETLAQARVFINGLSEGAMRPNSWAKALFESERTGKLKQGDAALAIAAYIFPSLDTTILSQGHLLSNLARNPGQWNLLRGHPELVPAAVLENVRHSAVVRWFSRYVAVDYGAGEHIIPSGSRVMLMYASANRDERRYPDPDKFEIRRNPISQLGWGIGKHLCAGMHLARMEMEVLLEALIEANVTFAIDHPEPLINRGLHGFARLPCRLDRNTGAR